MEAPQLNDDFRELLAALRQEGADYLIVGAHALHVLGREALIANKRATGRPKDQADVLLLTGGKT